MKKNEIKQRRLGQDGYVYDVTYTGTMPKLLDLKV